MWSIRQADSIPGRASSRSASAQPPPPPSSYPTTSGGLYDLDTLDEELVTATASSSAVEPEPRFDNLRSLDRSATFAQMLRAADADVAQHAARTRKAAAVARSSWRERAERRKRWDARADALRREAAAIVRGIDAPVEGTAAEVAKERLVRWQRALELYCFCPEEEGMTLLKLLEKLIEGCGEVRGRVVGAARDISCPVARGGCGDFSRVTFCG